MALPALRLPRLYVVARVAADECAGDLAGHHAAGAGERQGVGRALGVVLLDLELRHRAPGRRAAGSSWLALVEPT